MIDLGISKLTLIGIVALIVIGPEKLPGIARMLGTLVGRAQRYIHDLKAEVGNVAGFDELRQMKQSMEQTAWDLERQMHDVTSQVRRNLNPNATMSHGSEVEDAAILTDWQRPAHTKKATPLVRKNWRLKRSAMPHWYKARHNVRTRALSGAARVAHYRPQKPSSS